MSDEDDYMSDKFLSGSQDVRPSLINSRVNKRKINVELKRRDNNKKQKAMNGVVDNESLQVALSKPLSQENKGFKLLAKMGYKQGQALGKSHNIETACNNEGRLIEPIGITLKTDRQGLGREAALQELNERRQKLRQIRLNNDLGGGTSIEDFRRRSNQKHEEKFVISALKRCQVTCENLDIKSNVEKPDLQWFWPERATHVNEVDSSDDVDSDEKLEDNTDEFTNQEKLELLSNYLRTSYLFCYWCGISYNDEKDLKDNCPGLTKDDH